MRKGQYIGYLLDIIIALALFSFSSLITKRLFNIQTNSILLLLMFIHIILYRLLKDKINNEGFKKVFITLVVIVVAIIINGGNSIIDNLILIGLQGMLINHFDSKEIDKEYYFSIAKKIFVIAMLCTIFQLGMTKDFIEFINKIYVLMLILTLLLLRAVRNYGNRIEEKNEKIKIIGIMVLIPMLANEFVYSIIMSIFKSFYKVIMFALTIIITIVMYPLIKLLDIAVSSLPKRMETEIGLPPEGEITQKILDIGQGPKIFEFIIILVSIVAIYFFINKLMSKEKRKVEECEDIIIREGLDKINTTKNRRKQVSYKDKDNRTVVKKIFYDIIYRLDRKEMYKKSNTATEVVSKVSSCKEDINSIERIYNKAKFSKASITDQDVLIMKEEYTKIKKDLRVKVKE